MTEFLKYSGGMALLLLLSACLDTGGSSSSSGGIGSVGLSLTDAPSEVFSKVEIEIRKVELLPSDDDGERVTIYDNPTGQPAIDLLSLRDHAVMLSMADDVPAGRYSKLRVHVGAIQLYDRSGNPITEPVKLPSSRIDVNPRGAFELGDGDALYVQLDLDAHKSFQVKVSGNGEQYIFRPVVFADVLSEREPGKLIRASGSVRDLNTLDGSTWFALCSEDDDDEEPEQESDNDDDDDDDDGKRDDEDCMNVVANPEKTAVFNAAADPVGLGFLEEGQWVTAIGRPRHGEFKSMNAMVLESGEPGEEMPESYAAVKGTVDDQPAPGNGGFEVEDEEFSRAVQLQPGAPVVSRQGELLDEAAIVAGVKIKTEGVVDINGTLKATLAVVTEESDEEATKLGGVFASLDDESFEMLVEGTTYVVRFEDDTKVLRVGEADGKLTSKPAKITDLLEAREIEVYGEVENDSTVEAETILLFD